MNTKSWMGTIAVSGVCALKCTCVTPFRAISKPHFVRGWLFNDLNLNCVVGRNTINIGNGNIRIGLKDEIKIPIISVI